MEEKQNSAIVGMLWAMAKATALAVVPDGDGIAAGDDVDVIVL